MRIRPFHPSMQPHPLDRRRRAAWLGRAVLAVLAVIVVGVAL